MTGQTISDQLHEGRVEFDPQPSPSMLGRHRRDRARAHEWIEHESGLRWCTAITFGCYGSLHSYPPEIPRPILSPRSPTPAAYLLRTGGQQRLLHQSLRKDGVVLATITGSGQLPDIPGVLA